MCSPSGLEASRFAQEPFGIFKLLTQNMHEPCPLLLAKERIARLLGSVRSVVDEVYVGDICEDRLSRQQTLNVLEANPVIADRFAQLTSHRLQKRQTWTESQQVTDCQQRDEEFTALVTPKLFAIVLRQNYCESSYLQQS